MTFELNDDLIFLITDCHRLLRDCSDRRMLDQSRDITFGDARSLALIASVPDLRQCDIAAYHHIEWPSANGLLLRLERRDLIERRCDSADRRAKRIRITEMGRQVLSEMSCEIARIEDVALADIDGAIRSQLQSFFKAFWGNLASSTIDPLLRNGNSLIQMRICSERNESGADHQ